MTNVCISLVYGWRLKKTEVTQTMDDSEIIDLFFERSEKAIVELSNKYGSVCLKVSMNISSILFALLFWLRTD